MNIEQNVIQVPIESIIPNRFQPRLNFDDRGLEELASSIKQHGIIQPLVLRRIENKYEIIAGERRYKAAVLAGLKVVPGIVADIDDKQSAEVAIVENVQRKPLTPIEEARSFKGLLEQGMTQAELAQKLGISQSAVANKLRLLNLAEEVQMALLNNKISERHARSLLVLPNTEEQKKWLNKIIEERLTVRALDDAIKSELKNITPEEDLDIPLVRPLDIEAIKKEATELPKIDDEDDIAKKLREIERERMYNPDIIPVEQATNESSGNFFNFLENEKVNMNMEEFSIPTPIIELPNMNDTLNQIEIPNDKPEIVEPPKLNSVETPIPEVQEQAPISNQTFNQIPTSPTNLNTNFGANNDFDPVELIDTLDPNYTTVQEQKIGVDLKTAINSIRNAKDNLTEKGFNVSLEETDLTDTYQFIIKIKKD